MRVLLALLIACGSESAPAPVADTPLTVDAMPPIPGGKVITAVHETHGGLSGSWCVDEADLERTLADQLARDGWIAIETRASTSHHAMTAKRDKLRFSAQLMTGNDRCGGTVVNATVRRILDAF